jgi:hypothetical protein
MEENYGSKRRKKKKKNCRALGCVSKIINIEAKNSTPVAYDFKFWCYFACIIHLTVRLLDAQIGCYKADSTADVTQKTVGSQFSANFVKHEKASSRGDRSKSHSPGVYIHTYAPGRVVEGLPSVDTLKHNLGGQDVTWKQL